MFSCCWNSTPSEHLRSSPAAQVLAVPTDFLSANAPAPGTSCEWTRHSASLCAWLVPLGIPVLARRNSRPFAGRVIVCGRCVPPSLTHSSRPGIFGLLPLLGYCELFFFFFLTVFYLLTKTGWLVYYSSPQESDQLSPSNGKGSAGQVGALS